MNIIKAGGLAMGFLVFKHSQHQIEQARQLANELGWALIKELGFIYLLRNGRTYNSWIKC